MMAIGQGFASAKRLCAIMNIPSLPTKNNYAKLNKSLKTAVYNVSQESKNNAGKELEEKDKDECSVSVGGSWQKRGLSR